MRFRELALKGVYSIELHVIEDQRGGFARTYCKNEFKKIGFEKDFVQFNHSWNRHKGTIRGMHYQIHPFKEFKLIRCVSGAVHDVLIDLRRGSETFLKSISILLSAQNKNMLLIPEGLAHGFQTLEDETQLLYHHTEYYSPGFEGGLNFSDPSLNLSWPVPVTVVSDRDRSHKFLDNTFKGLE